MNLKDLQLSPEEISYKMVEQKLYDPRILSQILPIANQATLKALKIVKKHLDEKAMFFQSDKIGAGNYYISHYDIKHLESLIKEMETK
jgi:hypothetical protein